MWNFKVKQKHILYQAFSSPLPSYVRKVPRVDKHAPFLHAQKIVYISPNETLVQVQVFTVIELDQIILWTSSSSSSLVQWKYLFVRSKMSTESWLSSYKTAIWEGQRRGNSNINDVFWMGADWLQAISPQPIRVGDIWHAWHFQAGLCPCYGFGVDWEVLEH